jgi:hypothetical protein
MLTEVKQYRPYSTDLKTAWDAVEHLSASGEALQVRRDASRWVAAFGKGPQLLPIARRLPFAWQLCARKALRLMPGNWRPLSQQLLPA